MFWADRIAKEIQATRKPKDGEKFLVRDEKTMSGRPHVGSMRSVAVHGLVAEVLNDIGSPARFRFELNDFDPFDSVPGFLSKEKYAEHLGKPLYAVPSPEDGFENYAEFFGLEYVGVHKKAGFDADYYRATELYRSGKMDEYIRTALDRVVDVRRILKEVSGSVKDDAWLPISVVCESCGKMMTTRAHDWDGETVAYSCDRNPEDIQSCGASGRVSPFKGGSKLFWKTDWAAKWNAVGVDVEGGGKDHSTKGGARDVANHVCKQVFGQEPPFDTPYEFFLVGGKKMSTSKGSGSTALEMSQLFPPEVFRLVLIGKDIREQINIDPSGDSIPTIYDWYDELAEHYRSGVADDYTRLFTFCQLPENQATPSAPWQLRFSQVAFMVQMPHLKLEAEAERIKGSPLTEDEKRVLGERAAYAKFWLATYAPEEFKYELQQALPAVSLSDDQKKGLSALHAFIEAGEKTGEEIQGKLFELKTEIPIAPKELFQAIYRIFLNRDSGPKAGWFLSVLPRVYLLARLKEASA